MQNARVTLRYKDNLGEFDHIDEQLVFDLRFDPSSYKVDVTRPVFGIYGSSERAECYPFVLKKDGRMDYGAYADSSERYGSTNLLEKKLNIGELATVIGTEGKEWVYYIHAIDLL